MEVLLPIQGQGFLGHEQHFAEVEGFELGGSFQLLQIWVAPQLLAEGLLASAQRMQLITIVRGRRMVRPLATRGHRWKPVAAAGIKPFHGPDQADC